MLGIFDEIDIEDDDDDASQLDSFFPNALDATGSVQTKPIYLSFYSPATMLNIPTMAYADRSVRFSFSYNVLVFLVNVLVSLFKYLMTKSNELTIYVTKDVNYPDYNFSHVEISTDDHTYVAKWGSTFKRFEGKLLSPDRYGVFCVNLSRKDYDIVVIECESATKNELKFNYVGSWCNFLLPERVRNALFENGAYESDDSCFCSEFVSRALVKTSAFKHLFEEENLVPAMVSPIKLCILVSKFSAERITNVTMSTKLFKKGGEKKKIAKTKT